MTPKEFQAWLAEQGRSYQEPPHEPSCQVFWNVKAGPCRIVEMHKIRGDGRVSEFLKAEVVPCEAVSVEPAVVEALGRSRLIDIAPAVSSRGWGRIFSEHYLINVHRRSVETLSLWPVIRVWRGKTGRSGYYTAGGSPIEVPLPFEAGVLFRGLTKAAEVCAGEESSESGK